MPTETIRDEQVGTNGPTTEQVWRAISKASFAVLSEVNAEGEPRSSGVVYKALGRRLYTAVAAESWKAKQVAAHGRVAVTVTVPRGGLLSLVVPIPPATISFHATANVRPATAPECKELLAKLGSMLPKERRETASIVEIVPEGMFLTYGIEVPLTRMREPAAARGRVPV